MPTRAGICSKSDNGQDLLEYALILPFLLLLTFSIIEGGILFFRYSTVANAAREGARAGIVPPSAACDLTCVHGRASSAAHALTVGLDPAKLVIVVDVSRTDFASVSVTYDADLITAPVINALGGDGTIQLTATATMRKE
jgi:Flp pilus assembly protein TadG